MLLPKIINANMRKDKSLSRLGFISNLRNVAVKRMTPTALNVGKLLMVLTLSFKELNKIVPIPFTLVYLKALGV